VSHPASASNPVSEADDEAWRPRRADLIGSPRGWQREAHQKYFRIPRRDFLLVATPGAGKTAFALSVAAELLACREIAALTVVTPTQHLKHQWARAAHEAGIAMDSGYRNAQGRLSATSPRWR
jgi:superfamily II DNA or RNA helicase